MVTEKEWKKWERVKEQFMVRILLEDREGLKGRKGRVREGDKKEN